MTVELIKRMMDACYQAKRVRDLLPPLPKGVMPSYIHYLDSIQKLDGKEFLTARGRLDTLEFIGVYLSVFMLGTMVLCMCGFDIGDSMFEFASALGTVGLSVGITSYDASPAVLWTETAGMFVGRLEIYVVFVAAVQLGREIKHGAQKRGRRWKKYAR